MIRLNTFDKCFFYSIKRFPKPSLSPQQADGVLRSASRRKSLTSNWAQQAAGIIPNLK